ncbi:MAG: ABC transporter permease [Acidimicrobiia bacterium]|nr:ABC transporter permease [Acidimicrobiia bacterium]
MFVGLRDLWFARGRFALMTTVVALVALLVVMLSGLTAGLAADNVSAIEHLEATHIVFQDSGDGPSYDQSRLRTHDIEQWTQLPGVTAATPLGISRATMTAGDSSIPVVLFAAETGTFLAPSQLGTDGTVVIPSALADRHQLSTNDRLTISDSTFAVSIVPSGHSFSHSPVVWMDLHDWQQITGNDGSATVFALQADSGIDGQPIKGSVVKPLNDTFSAIGSFPAENGSLQMIRGFLLVISALVIGAFFTVWTIQRRHDVAVLKAMGASTRYLLADALGQALIVLTASALIGGITGFMIGELVSGSVPFVSDVATTVYPLLIMVAIGLLGAALAIRSITKVDPLTALGGSK